MRILEINKFFYPRGGVEVVFFDTIRGLRERGHQVAEFSMHHPKNLPSPYEFYFASELPELLGSQSFATKIRMFKRFLHSPEIEHKITDLVEKARPDIAHIHGAYRHLSASTFTTLRRLKIPIVVTLHDFYPLSPSRNFIIGETLNEAAYKKLFSCTRARCVDNAFLPSLAGDLEAYYYRLRRIWQHVDRFICPSQFMADKMVEWGFPREKMVIIHNPFTPLPQTPKDLPLGDSVLYLGRLHPEKGIKFLLEAAARLLNTKFILVGSGPMEGWITDFITSHKLTNVELWGHVAHGSERYFEAIRRAKVMVTPSLFYENCSMTILETLSYRRLAVVTNRGGNPEMVADGHTGFLAKPEDAEDLTRVLDKTMALPDAEAAAITSRGHDLVARAYNSTQHLDAVENLFRELITS